jgi:hypothetical protein
MKRSAGRSHAARVESLFERMPRAYEAIHDPRLAHAAWRDACDALHDPVRTVATPTGRAVMLTQQALFTFDADGALGVTMATPSETDLLRVAPTGRDQVSIAPLLPRWYWLQRRRERLVARMMQSLRAQRHDELAPDDASGAAVIDEDALRMLVDAWSRWVFARIRRDIAARFDLSAIRTRMGDGLALDPEVLAFARRLRRRHRSVVTRSLVTLGDYETARRHLATLRRLHAQTPALLPLWSAVFSHEPAESAGATDAARALRAWVLGLGCSPRTWRLVAAHGTRTLDAVQDHYRCRQPVLHWPDVVSDWLILIDVLELRRMPPAWLLRTLLGLYGNPNAPKADYGRMLVHEASLPLLRHAFACLQRLPDWGASQRDAVQRVLEWVSDTVPTPVLDAPRRRAGWTWLDAKARDAGARRRAQAEADGACWPVPLRPMRIASVDVRPITDAFALWQEGTQMRHCANLMRDRLAGRSDCALLSLRKGPSRSDRATALLVCDESGRWRVGQVSGFANAPAPAWAVRVAQRVCGRLGRPGNSRLA